MRPVGSVVIRRFDSSGSKVYVELSIEPKRWRENLLEIFFGEDMHEKIANAIVDRCIEEVEANKKLIEETGKKVAESLAEMFGGEYRRLDYNRYLLVIDEEDMVGGIDDIEDAIIWGDIEVESEIAMARCIKMKVSKIIELLKQGRI